jgi:DMSO/TMAO reductase YedYZ molybdopterin-dependent catalytic subunit
MRPRIPREEDFHSPAHAPAVSARIGLWLGVAFAICFLTGLASHFAQHPVGWFSWPTRPVSLYRITQGTHVISGIAAIPLLLAKLWSVYPRLFARPPLRPPTRVLVHGLQRLSILVLLAAAFFELVTGLFNVAQSYPWHFFFPAVHYAVAWLAIGALAVHIGVKLPVIQTALAKAALDEAMPSVPSPDEPASGKAMLAEAALAEAMLAEAALAEAALADPVRPAPGPRSLAPEPGSLAASRRAFLRTTSVAAGAAVLATAGVTVPWLRRFSPLAWSSNLGPQGLPVNRTAGAAGIRIADDWRLEVSWPGGSRSLTLAELSALPQRTTTLPIACVEGWSATASWSGVPVIDLLSTLGAPTHRAVQVSSLDKGLYGASTLPAGHAADPLTLLALRINGEILHPDHGYPCRIIAPSRPGVLQTKWVTRLEVVQ